MPWKERNSVTERLSLVRRYLRGERVTDLAHEFGISRKTAYKFIERYNQFGESGLLDQSRRPKNCHTTPDEVKKLVLRLRLEHLTWGPDKLKEVLEEREKGVRIPAASTIGALLKAEGLVQSRPGRRRRTGSAAGPLEDSSAPNDVWTADHKGQFRLGNGNYCYPLTICDHYSRFLIACEGLRSTSTEEALPVFEASFKKYGLPKAIRSDNGTPFASTGLLGLSRLSVWALRLGIDIQRIEPGHPEQNGRHERLHLTLKQDTIRPAASTSLQQQERFDSFADIYNHQRPHQALDMSTPADVYSPSASPFPEELPPADYRLEDDYRKVQDCGKISLCRSKHSVYLSLALAGEYVGLREVEPSRWRISFLHLELGHYDEATRRFDAN